MSYVPMPAAKTSSSSMAFKIMTFVGAALAVCLLLASVLMGFGAHSRSAQAEEARSNAESLRNEKKDTDTETASVRTQITAAKSNKAANKWCDGFTEADSGFTDLIDNATALNFKPADELAAIAKACPKKKEFAEAFRDAPSPAFTGNVPDCTLSGGNVTMTGELTITDTTLSNLGPMNVTVNIFLTPGEPTNSDTPAGTATFTIPAGGKGTFTQTLPSGGLTTGTCSFRATNLWPKGL